MQRRASRRVVAVVGAAVVGAVAGGAAASIVLVDASGVIHACVQQPKGAVRIVAPGEMCHGNEIPVSWNQAGPPGQPGAAGPPGPTGPEGAPGAPGGIDRQRIYSVLASSDGSPGPNPTVSVSCASASDVMLDCTCFESTTFESPTPLVSMAPSYPEAPGGPTPHIVTFGIESETADTCICPAATPMTAVARCNASEMNCPSSPAAEYGSVCGNGCGIGVVDCDGSCTVAPAPANLGESCDTGCHCPSVDPEFGFPTCGALTNTGVIGCDGSCEEVFCPPWCASTC